ncbi:MAG: hypothetical protein JXB88_16865, partial [Spirochaetales bacterium]|nr:hypothetical protein [Spirochaetales bacterium]
FLILFILCRGNLPDRKFPPVFLYEVFRVASMKKYKKFIIFNLTLEELFLPVSRGNSLPDYGM